MLWRTSGRWSVIYSAKHLMGCITIGKLIREIRQKARWNQNWVFVSCLSQQRWVNYVEWRQSKPLSGSKIFLKPRSHFGRWNPFCLQQGSLLGQGNRDLRLVWTFCDPHLFPKWAIHCQHGRHQQGESGDVAIPATVDYTMLKSLIRGALAVLTPYLTAK